MTLQQSTGCLKRKVRDLSCRYLGNQISDYQIFFFSWKLRSIRSNWILKHCLGCLGAEIFKKQNRILKLIISYSYCLIGASKQQNLRQAPQTGPKQALIAPKWLLVGLVTQTNWIDVITNFISIVFKICGNSKYNNLSFDQNHLIKNPILFRKYLSPKKLLKKVWAFNTSVWISVFRRKKRFENQIFGCWDIKVTSLHRGLLKSLLHRDLLGSVVQYITQGPWLTH